MNKPTQTDCAVCQASRRSVVDSFLLGYAAGLREATEIGMGQTLDRPVELCLPHSKMLTQAQIDFAKLLLKTGT